MNDKRIEAEKAAAKEKMLTLRAEALKAEAGYLQDHAGANEKAVAEAWDKYQEATNEAARAKHESEQIHEALHREKWSEALRAAAAVKVRDYLLVDDIPAQAAGIDGSITFADLVAEALRAGSAATAADNLAEAYDLDSEPREKIANRIEWLIECADDEGLDPATTLTPKARQ